jgi:hypothetical protein
MVASLGVGWDERLLWGFVEAYRAGLGGVTAESTSIDGEFTRRATPRRFFRAP